MTPSLQQQPCKQYVIIHSKYTQIVESGCLHLLPAGVAFWNDHVQHSLPAITPRPPRTVCNPLWRLYMQILAAPSAAGCTRCHDEGEGEA